MKQYRWVTVGVAATVVLAVTTVAVLFYMKSLFKHRQVQIAESEIHAIERSLLWYHDAYGDLPGDFASLTNASKIKDAPLASIFTDPWEKSYVYERLGRSNFIIRSYGPDQTPDTEDDISGNWESGVRRRKGLPPL